MKTNKYRAVRTYFPHGWQPQININGVFHSIGKAVFLNPNYACHFAELWNDGMPGECEAYAQQHANLEDI